MAKPTVHHLHATSIATKAAAVATAELTVLRNFAFGHWRAARRLADLLEAHEHAHQCEPFGDQFEDARSFGTAAILMAYAAIEAGVDELQLALGIPAAPIAAFTKGTPVDRLNVTLKHHGKSEFKKGGKLGQRVELLRLIRNAFAHPKAGADDDPNFLALGAKIKAAKLKLSPIWPEPDKPFPYGVMSAGVAHWAADCARDFLNEMNALAGLKPIVNAANCNA